LVIRGQSQPCPPIMCFCFHVSQYLWFPLNAPTRLFLQWPDSLRMRLCPSTNISIVSALCIPCSISRVRLCDGYRRSCISPLFLSPDEQTAEKSNGTHGLLRKPTRQERQQAIEHLTRIPNGPGGVSESDHAVASDLVHHVRRILYPAIREDGRVAWLNRSCALRDRWVSNPTE
jgi:hypothetical protein